MMHDQNEVRTPTAFLAFAGDDVEKWKLAISCKVIHRDYGAGIISRVYESEDGIRIRVQFSQLERHSERNFAPEAFLNGHIADIELPQAAIGAVRLSARGAIYLLQKQQAAEQEQETTERTQQQALTILARREAAYEKLRPYRDVFRKERAIRALRDDGRTYKWLLWFAICVEWLQRQLEEASDRQHFIALKQQYGINYYEDSPTSPLYMLLVKMKGDGDITGEDVDWLNQHGLVRQLAKPLATWFEKRASETGNAWCFVRASRHWRDAGEPARAVAITDWSAMPDVRLETARLTTRGGALRDLERLDEALTHGQRALSVGGERPHPHNLLGAIYFQKGEAELGIRHFERAVALGATTYAVDTQQKEAVARSGPEEQRRVVEYLLAQDPVRYRWAQRYLLL